MYDEYVSRGIKHFILPLRDIPCEVEGHIHTRTIDSQFEDKALTRLLFQPCAHYQKWIMVQFIPLLL